MSRYKARKGNLMRYHLLWHRNFSSDFSQGFLAEVL